MLLLALLFCKKKVLFIVSRFLNRFTLHLRCPHTFGPLVMCRCITGIITATFTLSDHTLPSTAALKWLFVPSVRSLQEDDPGGHFDPVKVQVVLRAEAVSAESESCGPHPAVLPQLQRV